jgi:hypothetical protein
VFRASRIAARGITRRSHSRVSAPSVAAAASRTTLQPVFGGITNGAPGSSTPRPRHPRAAECHSSTPVRHLAGPSVRPRASTWRPQLRSGVPWTWSAPGPRVHNTISTHRRSWPSPTARIAQRLPAAASVRPTDCCARTRVREIGSSGAMGSSRSRALECRGARASLEGDRGRWRPSSGVNRGGRWFLVGDATRRV